jgi:hypothetical protein
LDRQAANLLALDLRQQLQVIARIYDRVGARLRDASDQDPATVEALAYQLHNLYGACEQLFELIARAFENQIDARRYHVDLLRRMTMEITGVRPALLSEALELDLHELRAFRHFFRHAYGIDLSPAKVRAVTAAAARTQPALKEALDRFILAIGGETET